MRAILVEININLDSQRKILADLEGVGFSHDPKEAETCRYKEGPFAGSGNYIFRR